MDVPGMVETDNLFLASVLAALYNNARVSYNPFVLAKIAKGPPMDVATAQRLVDDSWHDLYFHRVQGRLLRVNLNNPSFNPALYDSQHGPGAAARAIAHLRETGEVILPDDKRRSQPLPKTLKLIVQTLEVFGDTAL